MNRYDVFISYAIEDKYPFASNIAAGLREKGLRVYFVGDELSAGESVSEIVYDGLERSEYCVLLLSPDYVRKWPIIERSHILRREKKSGRTLVFPVWHRITPDEVHQMFPELYDHYAESTDKEMDELISNLNQGIRKQRRVYLQRKWSVRLLISLLLMAAVVFIAPSLLRPAGVPMPSDQERLTLINERIGAFEQAIDHELLKKQSLTDAVVIQLDSVKRIYNHYSRISGQSRNDFYFSNGWENIIGRANIESIGLVLAQSPHGAYGVYSSLIWRLDREETDSTFHLVLGIRDTVAAGFQVDSVFWSNTDSCVHMWVAYHHSVRLVYYTLNYTRTDQKLKQHVRIMGFKPKEELLVSNRSGVWAIQEIK